MLDKIHKVHWNPATHEAHEVKRSLYGKKMLVADLIVTSVWALFAIKSMPWLESWMLAIIFMRIILCFQLYSKSAPGRGADRKSSLLASLIKAPSSA